MAYGNPMSQMADAAKLSIPQLQQALRNGTIDPQVGQLVLNSKIIADKKSKAAMQAQQPAQPPVVAQNAAYGAGVESLPSNLPAQTMAGGGIIAFAGPTDGSSVPAPEFDPYQSLSAKDYFNLPPELRAQHKGKVLFTGLDSQKPFESAHDKPTTGVKGLTSVPTSPSRDIPYGAVTEARIPKNKLVDATNWEIAPPATSAQTTKPQIIEANPNAVAPAAAVADTAITPSKFSEADYNFGSGKTSSSSSTRTKGNAGIGAFDASKGYKTTPYDDTILTELAAEELNPATNKKYTYEEIKARNKARGESEGIDYELYKKQAKELEGKKTRSDARIRLDEAMPWLAASEALGKSKSQYAVEGLTAGLGAYGRSAAEVSDKEETRQEGIRKEGNQLALAQNQFNQATSTGNRADLAAADAAVKQARTNLATLGMKSIDQQNAVAKDIFEAEAKLKGIAMQEAGANSRYGQEQQTIGMIASKVHAAHPEMAPDEVLKQAYMIKGASSVYGTDVKAGTAEVNKLEDIVKGLQAQLPKTFGSVKINALNQEIARAQANVEAARRGAPITSAAPSSNVIDFSKLPTAK